MKLREIFAEAVSKLRENEIINPERDARALVSFGVGITSDRLNISSEYLAGKEQIQKINHLLQRRIDGWPVSRILGKRLFCCLLYTSPSPRDVEESSMPSSA